MNNLVSIKGGKDGLRMNLDETADWPAIMSALQVQLGQGGSFFAGARLIVDIGERLLDEQQLSEVLALMQQHGLQPDSLAATARESRNIARSAGLTARPATRRNTTAPTVSGEYEAILLCRTVRSGQVIRHHGHITLVGDVNPGAELIAGGNVIVWGRLRGLVHAGALGDRGSLIGALELQPTQLRIADLIARTPEGASSRTPEIARVEADRIIVESWEGFRRS
jgi:septum site-determining protein MinC